jgi:hypothetical protein
MPDDFPLHDPAFAEQVPHRHVPGRAYEVADPAAKLIHMIGGGFFNEPKYYDSNRPVAAFYRELLTTGKIASVLVDEMGLSEQAREVLETAWAVASSDRPEDLLVIAAWARDPHDGLRLRTTPVMLLALAAAHPGTKPFVARYAPAVLRRADEVRLAFAAFRHLFQQGEGGRHRGPLPHCLRKGLARVLAGCSDYALLKYNDAGRPTFADVLKMVGGSRKLPGRKPAGWPVSRALFEYLVNGRIADDAPPVLQARRRFFAVKDPAEVTPGLVAEAALTWENIVSHLGAGKDVWELCIPIMGEMALTRNLRNFEQANLSPRAWELVRERLLAAEETVQLPFRFFSAAREVTTPEAREVLAVLLDRAVARVADLPGVTLALADNSGSAVGCAVSAKSKLRVADCGNMLAAVLAKRLGLRALVGVFGDSLIWVPFDPSASCLAIKVHIDLLAQREERSAHGALAIPPFRTGPGVGGGTETGLWFALDDLIRRRVRVDRIVFLSDLCCYTQGDDGTARNCGVNLEAYFGRGATVQSMVDRYRRAVNPDCCVYSVNLAGYGQSQLRPGDRRTHMLSGWSEKLLDTIRELEAGEPKEDSRAAQVPAIEVLRARYGRPA